MFFLFFAICVGCIDVVIVVVVEILSIQLFEGRVSMTTVCIVRRGYQQRSVLNLLVSLHSFILSSFIWGITQRGVV